MISPKRSVAIAALALCSVVTAGPCKAASYSTQTSISSATTTTDLFSESISLSASVASSTTEEASSSTLTTEASISLTDTTTTNISTTTDASTTETSMTSSAPQCTFAGSYTNYVLNPSFDDLDARGNSVSEPWMFFGGSKVASNEARTGQNAAELNFPSESNSNSDSIFQPNLGTVVGNQYVLKYYWTLLAGQPEETNYCRFGASGGQLQDRLFISAAEDVIAGQYYSYEVRFVASDHQRLSIGFFCQSTDNGEVIKVHIDDIAIYDYYEGCEVP
ncbi:hypothetical protein FZEAL_707 [Fusarium zealandicum]|uniref:CBM-cenC domain-containing protein n=1 Tax=Fusarium zealandicum TaxID=1053134 RepID=A0A8H4UUW0_9HYPO|nr:hypothetical protein FZEAL_707 [Fusarium zealandicum]